MKLSQVLLLLLLFTALSCKQRVQRTAAGRDALRKELMAADSSFSALSAGIGHKKAFLSYIDSTDGTLIRAGKPPVKGKDALAILAATSDSGATLTWKPLFADVAASGELGYTYGTYTYNTTDTSIKGNYCSIWRKNNRGNWRFVVDIGN
ncbi:hypothetical protein COR50_13425 [Chitinophaga caeni]|uniref:DUF4440 domain-containing protein n=1 Tax=Chitinophaga caeni TaxID=2029983 RepID=A0A291QW56_9BACT|nr:hypothetical protein [Chitinophaga caeni]ATL48084.1 hypothetical protein COR50_13425 [Chitinophaga caeni]